ncbi:MAG TPA: methylamine dehydrogenase light chain [Myxococcota bacterium]|nr:methylamine dehydrogenase light chain [Myxococcota bacterium]
MKSLEGRIDRWLEGRARLLARRTSRRSFLARLSALLFGAAAFPLLPVARAGGTAPRVPAPDESTLKGEVADPTSCQYWRHCAIDGLLCSCCGGTQNACPPGTEMSRVTWIGTCRHPADGKDYIISYNDCCGKSFCGRCQCNRNEGEKPVYVTPRNNDIVWCFGTQSTAYNCSTAIVLGIATEG